MSVAVVSTILEVMSDDWDACCVDATGLEKYNPFLTHAFLSSLEESGCAVKVSQRLCDCYTCTSTIFYFF